jgi:hypothetical protein
MCPWYQCVPYKGPQEQADNGDGQPEDGNRNEDGLYVLFGN